MKRYKVSNAELRLNWNYWTKKRALYIAKRLNDLDPDGKLSIEDVFVVHNRKTGELIR